MRGYMHNRLKLFNHILLISKELHQFPNSALPQIKAIGQAELNTSNPEEVLQLAAQKRKKRFLQAMAKLYF